MIPGAKWTVLSILEVYDVPKSDSAPGVISQYDLSYFELKHCPAVDFDASLYHCSAVSDLCDGFDRYQQNVQRWIDDLWPVPSFRSSINWDADRGYYCYRISPSSSAGHFLPAKCNTISSSYPGGPDRWKIRLGKPHDTWFDAVYFNGTFQPGYSKWHPNLVRYGKFQARGCRWKS
ncbi:hypothetical protein HDU89_008585 [Geranomyces variabilis]|nr:hypothetical protein HDU89_008585 [Geranomyces variabilis]